MAVQYKQQKEKAVREGQIPDDLGLMQNTFIMPTGKNRPSWFSDFKRRWRLERVRWKTRWTEFFPALAYRFVLIRPRPRLHLSQIPIIGKDLHNTMFEHFSTGKLQPVEAQLCQGLLGSLRSRIAQRPPNVHFMWTLDAYLSSPKLVSYKVVLLPGGDLRAEKNGVVQAVVRIHSVQSIRRFMRQTIRDSGLTRTVEIPVDAEGRELPPSKDGRVPWGQTAKETTEYVVVQKSLRKNKEGPWMVWGMAQETTLEMLDRKKRNDNSGRGRKV